MVVLDCTTKDIERLDSRINTLATKFAELQVETIKDLEVRDQMIVVNASLDLLQKAAQKAGKQSTTPRFIRSITSALTVARKFGTGRSKVKG